MNSNKTRYHHVKKVWMVLPFCLFTFLPLSAQTFTERIQKSAAGQASVVIHQDAEIDKLVNSATLGNTTPRPAATTTPSPTANHSATTPSSSATAGKPTPSEKPAEANDTVDLHKKLMRGGVKVNGYRVQAFAGGNSRKDRLQAEQVGNNIKAHYANVPVYVHFYSPRWICRVGNYRTYEEAHQMLQSLRKLGYSQASIVRGKITVQY